MNILGRNLLSLTVYHLRSVARKVFGGVVIDDVVVNPDGTVTVGGEGGEPGDTVVITFPDGSVGSGQIGIDGEWEVTSPDVVDPVPGPEDLVLDVTPTPAPPGTPEIDEITPNPDGTVDVGGGGGSPGDQVEVEFPDGSVGEGEVDEDGDWDVTSPTPQDPDLDPDDLEVVITPPPAEPVIEEVECTFDSSTVSGVGARDGDTVVVTFPDGQVVQAIADALGAWSVTATLSECPLAEDLVIEVIPNPASIITLPKSVIWADIAGMEYAEVDDDGNFIIWEQMVEQILRIVGIQEPAAETIKFPTRYSGFHGVTLMDSTYIAAFDESYVVFESATQLDEATETVIPKHYTASYNLDVFKTEHTAWLLKSEGEQNRLIRYDGGDTGLLLPMFSDGNRPFIASLGAMDWVFTKDCSVSYLIDPITLAAQPGPTFDIALMNPAYASAFTTVSGRVFVIREDYSTVELHSDGSYTQIANVLGGIFGGDKYLYILGSECLRIDVSSGESEVLGLQSYYPTSGYSKGDFAIFRNTDRQTLSVTYDAGKTFETIADFGILELLSLSVESERLAVSRNYSEFNVYVYNLLAE